MDKGQINYLAEKIALIISTESKSDYLRLQKNIDAMSKRLDMLESPLTLSQEPVRISHSSQDRFSIAEAIVDGLFERDGLEKACTFEPNGKPCDHCSMCSSRGF